MGIWNSWSSMSTSKHTKKFLKLPFFFTYPKTLNPKCSRNIFDAEPTLLPNWTWKKHVCKKITCNIYIYICIYYIIYMIYIYTYDIYIYMYIYIYLYVYIYILNCWRVVGSSINRNHWRLCPKIGYLEVHNHHFPVWNSPFWGIVAFLGQIHISHHHVVNYKQNPLEFLLISHIVFTFSG